MTTTTMRRTTTISLLIATLTLILASLPAPARSEESPDALANIGRLVLPTGDAIASNTAPPADIAKALSPASPAPRIAIISSGVDDSALPASLRSQIDHLDSGIDSVGYGTYAASVLLQVAPGARITSLQAYSSGILNSTLHESALRWVFDHATSLDAVYYAIPPSDFLDPITASMGSGTWDAVLDAIGNNPIRTGGTTLLGVATDPSLRSKQAAASSPDDRSALRNFADLVIRWQTAVSLIENLKSRGVALVAPAGDLGPHMQTIFGVAGLPGVITVGGVSDDGISPGASIGPSVYGGTKPDLVAPTGVVGLLPPGSPLATALGAKGLINSALQPSWDAGNPPTTARARLDTTLSSAAVVTAAVAGLAAQGVRDVAAQRGALIAASVPLSGVPVWTQGAGALRFAPSADTAQSRSLALAIPTLGLQPENGNWSTNVPFSSKPLAGTATITDLARVMPDGMVTSGVSGSAAPAPVVTIEAGKVTITLPAGPDTYEPGLYCGYTDVTLPTGSQSPQFSLHGVPEGTEQLPTCFIQGTRMSVNNFYIHDLPTANMTFGLLPSMPPDAKLLEHPMILLPKDPTESPMFLKVSGADGKTDFLNVPPGYYKMRQWTDYAVPINQTVTDASTGQAKTIESDIGENPAYQSYDGYILSSRLTETDLRNTFGTENVQLEKSSLGYWVTSGGRAFRVFLGVCKKMPGASISSRYIDLLGYDDFAFSTTKFIDTLWLSQVDPTPAGSLKSWLFEKNPQNRETVDAIFNPLFAATHRDSVIGIAQYPFNITTPNYSMNMSLNFTYDTTNAYIVAAVTVGEETSFNVITPNGTIELPGVGINSRIRTDDLKIGGHAKGTASIEISMKPKNVPTGMLTFILAPTNPSDGTLAPSSSAPVSKVQLSNISFLLDTWIAAFWPGGGNEHGMGHGYSFRSGYSSRQVTPERCRNVIGETTSANVCEDWQIIVHTPGDDAAVVDVHDVDSGNSIATELLSDGASYYDPQRGTSDFSSFFAITTPAGTVPVGSSFKTSGEPWELLSIPAASLARYPGEIHLEVLDNVAGRQSTLFPHNLGSVPVAPYICNATTNYFAKTSSPEDIKLS